MKTKRTNEAKVADRTERQPHRVHLRGFVREEEIGLGDAIKRMTCAMGIKTLRRV